MPSKTWHHKDIQSYSIEENNVPTIVMCLKSKQDDMKKTSICMKAIVKARIGE